MDQHWSKWPGAPAPGTVLYKFSDLKNLESRGFVFGKGSNRFEMFIVRKDDNIFGYINACPHIGSPLEFMPNQFLNLDKTLIMCATHGAQFEIDNGLCVIGPCKDQHLPPVPVAIIGDDVVIEDA